MSEEKRQAQKKESMKFIDDEANKKEIKQTKMQAQHSSPPCSLPPKEFRKPRKFDRGNLAKTARDSVASLTNGAVTFSGGTMGPKQQKEPEERIENIWSGSEKGKKFKDDDQVMMITVSKETGKCDVLYLNAVRLG